MLDPAEALLTRLTANGLWFLADCLLPPLHKDRYEMLLIEEKALEIPENVFWMARRGMGLLYKELLYIWRPVKKLLIAARKSPEVQICFSYFVDFWWICRIATSFWHMSDSGSLDPWHLLSIILIKPRVCGTRMVIPLWPLQQYTK